MKRKEKKRKNQGKILRSLTSRSPSVRTPVAVPTLVVATVTTLVVAIAISVVTLDPRTNNAPERSTSVLAQVLHLQLE